MKVVLLAGGTGSAKLIRGFKSLPVELTVVSNVGDNFWTYGVYVCPDIDVATYALAGIGDREKGWGVAGDTFDVLSRLSRLGAETWFRLGDADLAACLARTELMRKGKTLTEATDAIRRALGVRAAVLPISDHPIETKVLTPRGVLHLQEFWVRDRGRPRVLDVRYSGARKARPTAEVTSAISDADRIVICPANPVTSIGPMLAIPGFSGLLFEAPGHKVALSPMEGAGPFSGPAGKFLKARGVRPDSVGVASLYRRFVDSIVISTSDSGMGGSIRGLGVECYATKTRMSGPADELRLAKELIEA